MVSTLCDKLLVQVQRFNSLKVGDKDFYQLLLLVWVGEINSVKIRSKDVYQSFISVL